MVKATREEAVEYNRELKETLTELWNSINKGQKKILKEHPNIKALLDRFKIPYGV